MPSSPLRYPGGKAKLFPFFARLIEANQLFGCEYIEPYAGGAGLAIKLLVDGFVDRIAINDLDVGIYSFWSSVFRAPDAFCELIEKTPVTIDEWFNQKKIWSECSGEDFVKKGFATFFLNRTNRSGIIGGAGPVGGFKQSGEWKIDARFNKSSLIENIKSLARLANKVSLANQNAIDFVKPKLKNKNRALIYLDPPYYKKAQKLYTNFYNHDDHIAIAKMLLQSRSAKWVVSYDQAPQLRLAYSQVRCIQYHLNYSAAVKTVGAEFIFLSDALTDPNIEGFRLAG